MDRPAKTTCCRFLERVPDAYAEGERTIVTDAAVTEHQARTEIQREGQREIEGIFKTHVAHNTDKHDVFRRGILPDRHAGAGTAVESPAAGRSPVRLRYHEVVDTVHMESVGSESIVQAKLELEEMRTTEYIILIADIYSVVADTATEGLWLGSCKSSETQSRYNDKQCFFHNSVKLISIKQVPRIP